MLIIKVLDVSIMLPRVAIVRPRIGGEFRPDHSPFTCWDTDLWVVVEDSGVLQAAIANCRVQVLGSC